MLELINSGKGKWHIPLGKIPKSYKDKWKAGDYEPVVETHCNRIINGEVKSIHGILAEDICGNCVNNLFKSKPHKEKVYYLVKENML